MTKVMIQIRDDGSIYFDCMNHSDFKDVCIMCSTLCNVLIMACQRAGISSITEEDAHVRIEIGKASPALIEAFRAVRNVFYAVEEQFPFYVKNY